jgi:hypothetical protein
MPGGGSKPGERRGGRKPGTPNKATLSVKEKLDALGHDPLAAMAEIAIEAREAARLAEGRDRMDWMKIAGNMNAELAGYVAPKRKAIEGGDPQNPVQMLVRWQE